LEIIFDSRDFFGWEDNDPIRSLDGEKRSALRCVVIIIRQMSDNNSGFLGFDFISELFNF
jgi:hypothetical protein